MNLLITFIVSLAWGVAVIMVVGVVYLWVIPYLKEKYRYWRVMMILRRIKRNNKDKEDIQDLLDLAEKIYNEVSTDD